MASDNVGEHELAPPKARFDLLGAVRVDAIVSIVAIGLGLLFAWGVSYAMGGSKSPAPHLFYVPIVIAAVRFSWTGAAVVAVAAGVIAGPVLPQDVAAQLAQPPENWVLRACMFLGIGLILALAVRGRVAPMRGAFRDSVISSRMLRAIRRGDLQPHFQPIYDNVARRMVGVEALSRWRLSRGGWMMPCDFIPAAERTGAIIALDRFILSEAVRTVNSWTDTGALVLSVNVSALRFARDDLVSEVRNVL